MPPACTVADVVSGPIPMSAVLMERRSGDGSVAIAGDLTQARLGVRRAGLEQAARGRSPSATATLLMSHDRPIKLDRIAVRGDGLVVTGSANFTDGRMRSVQLDHDPAGAHAGTRDAAHRR